MEEEEFEHIPWSHLATQDDDRKTKLIYLAVAAAAVAVIGVVGARWFLAPQHGPALPVAVAEPTSVATISGESVVETSTTTSTRPFSEADLMAAAPLASFGAEAMAAMRAEWFVTDYFTVDHDPSAPGEIARAFVGDAASPAVPHGAEEPGGTSYVEWSRTYRVDQHSPGIFAVAVAFRSIHLDTAGDFRRGPVRGAEVLVAVSDEAAGVVDLPMPIPPPMPSDLSGLPQVEGVAEDSVVQEAMAYAWIFDEEPDLIAAEGDGSQWRVVVGLEDGSGIVWPMAIRSDRLGR